MCCFTENTFTLYFDKLWFLLFTLPLCKCVFYYKFYYEFRFLSTRVHFSDVTLFFTSTFLHVEN